MDKWCRFCDGDCCDGLGDDDKLALMEAGPGLYDFILFYGINTCIDILFSIQLRISYLFAIYYDIQYVVVCLYHKRTALMEKHHSVDLRRLQSPCRFLQKKNQKKQTYVFYKK